MSALPSFGIDVGGSAVKWALLEGDAVVDSGSERIPPAGGDAVVDLVTQLACGPGLSGSTVGVAVPGHVERRSGTVLLMPNVPGEWAGLALGEQLRSRLGRPVHVLNDARALGLAELRLGAAAHRRDVVFATLGTGVGGAVAIDGQILSSRRDSAGELGHLTVDPDGLPCGCGGRGCLETVASAPALVAAAARAVLLGHSPALNRATGGSLDRLTAAAVTEAASADDEVCLRIIERAGRALGVALGNVCALLTLDTVVIGGGAHGAIDLLLPLVAQQVATRASLVPGITVLPAALGRQAGAVGAALFARESSRDLRACAQPKEASDAVDR